ncbi:hypothetical protein JDV02_006767 [Purpureocillium takamizusanense]|uniref:Uncharacterized protein n=1 Tax=Purpureocillium takamizusanense TaxID=2060973 RepID=A0A9Q8QKX2_9HYPO|nr:uncharacterized protein JDV02_006767 [Purpureocillium takamizusanense]UNI20701.1 hypothetical protein JDV02_006767 [Purpureocillium takamizusanense]
MKLATDGLSLAAVVALAGQTLGLPTADGVPSNVTTQALFPRKGISTNRSDYPKLVCGNYEASSEEDYVHAYWKNREYFEHIHKEKPTLRPEQCDRVGCWNNVGVWWCNETKKDKKVEDWYDIVLALDAIPLLKGLCSEHDYRTYSHQIFHKDGFSVIISHRKGEEGRC